MRLPVCAALCVVVALCTAQSFQTTCEMVTPANAKGFATVTAAHTPSKSRTDDDMNKANQPHSVFVVGTFQESAEFGDSAVTSPILAGYPKGGSTFVAELELKLDDQERSANWQTALVSSGVSLINTSKPLHVASTRIGNAVMTQLSVVGTFSGELKFAPLNSTTSVGGEDGFLLLAETNPQTPIAPLTLISVAGPGNDAILQSARSPENKDEIYIVGYFQGEAAVSATETIYGSGTTTAFVAKYKIIDENNNLELEWAVPIFGNAKSGDTNVVVRATAVALQDSGSSTSVHIVGDYSMNGDGTLVLNTTIATDINREAPARFSGFFHMVLSSSGSLKIFEASTADTAAQGVHIAPRLVVVRASPTDQMYAAFTVQGKISYANKPIGDDGTLSAALVPLADAATWSAWIPEVGGEVEVGVMDVYLNTTIMNHIVVAGHTNKAGITVKFANGTNTVIETSQVGVGCFLVGFELRADNQGVWNVSIAGPRVNVGGLAAVANQMFVAGTTDDYAVFPNKGSSGGSPIYVAYFNAQYEKPAPLIKGTDFSFSWANVLVGTVVFLLFVSIYVVYRKYGRKRGANDYRTVQQNGVDSEEFDGDTGDRNAHGVARR